MGIVMGEPFFVVALTQAGQSRCPASCSIVGTSPACDLEPGRQGFVLARPLTCRVVSGNTGLVCQLIRCSQLSSRTPFLYLEARRVILGWSQDPLNVP